MIIKNPPNVVGHEYEYYIYRPESEGGVDGRVVRIKDGSYSPEGYASMLQADFRDELGTNGIITMVDPEVSIETLAPGEVRIECVYESRNNSFDIAITNGSPYAIALYFNKASSDFLGLTGDPQADNGFYNINGNRTNKYHIRTHTAPIFHPRYYTLRSSDLSGFGYTENENGSNILAIIPNKDQLSSSTIWENNESHLHTLFDDVGELHYSLDLQFHTEDSETVIKDPQFLITFVTSS
ncbi:MAG: hypothetical protein V4708_17570 [Bacteroidota bacterium]